MNFLAHALLAGEGADGASLAGNLGADFYKGRPGSDLDPTVAKGVLTHRRVDAFAEDDPAFRASKRLVAPERQRYAGVVADVAYDHFLARNWERFAGVDLGRFIDVVYLRLEASRALAPPAFRAVLPAMIGRDWLRGYEDPAWPAATFARLARRVRPEHAAAVAGAGQDLRRHRSALEAHFLAFFPRVQTHVRHFREGGHGGGRDRSGTAGSPGLGNGGAGKPGAGSP